AHAARKPARAKAAIADDCFYRIEWRPLSPVAADSHGLDNYLVMRGFGQVSPAKLREFTPLNGIIYRFDGDLDAARQFLQNLAEIAPHREIPIWWVTRGAVRIASDTTPPSLEQAPLWGF